MGKNNSNVQERQIKREREGERARERDKVATTDKGDEHEHEPKCSLQRAEDETTGRERMMPAT